MAEKTSGTCEHCKQSFNYRLCHSGFGDCSYAYCDQCGMTAILDYWDKKIPKWPVGCPRHQEICVELERHIKPCVCGGAFRKGASPRCPRCGVVLAPEAATAYIEMKCARHEEGMELAKKLAWHVSHRHGEPARGKQSQDGLAPISEQVALKSPISRLSIPLDCTTVSAPLNQSVVW
jgi:phage FluMu protein Com